MSETRFNIAVIIALTLLMAIMSSPAWPVEPQIMWPGAGQTCAVQSVQLGVPIIRDLDPSEIALLDRINLVRTGNGLAPLTYAGDEVREVAQAHSERMLELGIFSHRDDLGRTAGERLTRLGVAWRAVGENLLEEVGAPSFDAVVDDAVRAWVASPDHRANILDATYTQTAVGIASRDGRTYLTQLFVAR